MLQVKPVRFMQNSKVMNVGKSILYVLFLVGIVWPAYPQVNGYPDWDGEYHAYVLRNHAESLRVITELVPVDIEETPGVVLSFHIRDFPANQNGELIDYPQLLQVSLNRKLILNMQLEPSVQSLGWVLPPVENLQQIDVKMVMQSTEIITATFNVASQTEISLAAMPADRQQAVLNYSVQSDQLHWLTFYCKALPGSPAVQKIVISQFNKAGTLLDALKLTSYQLAQPSYYVIGDVGLRVDHITRNRIFKLECQDSKGRVWRNHSEQ